MPDHARSRFASVCRSILVPGVLLAVVLAACGSDDDGERVEDKSAESDAPDLVSTVWTLSSVVIDGTDTPSAATASLEFAEDGVVSGSTGCNLFSGTYEQLNEELTIELGPMTQAACTDPSLQSQESAILATLDQVASVASGSDGALILQDSDGGALATYTPGLTSLEGTSWTATGINNGKDAVEASVLTETVTAEFGADGALSGLSGCNNYNATYELAGSDGITISGIATTRKACDEAAMTLETQYLAALEAAATYTVTGDSLTIRDADGATQATFVLAS